MGNGTLRYRLTHGGLAGPWEHRTLTCADPSAGQLVVLGELVSLVYLTQKGSGDPRPTEYEHEFSRPLPVLTFHQGGLVICGGRYRVGVRGIHG